MLANNFGARGCAIQGGWGPHPEAPGGPAYVAQVHFWQHQLGADLLVAVAMPKKKKSKLRCQRRKAHQEKLRWIGESLDQGDRLLKNAYEDWGRQIKAKGGWVVGRWRLTTVINYSSPFSPLDTEGRDLSPKDPNKVPGALWLKGNQWSLYYNKGEGPDLMQIVKRFQKHVLHVVGRWGESKEAGHVQEKTGRWVEHDHLTMWEYFAITRCNFEITLGHSKNDDGAEQGGRQVTHAFVQLRGKKVALGKLEY